MYIIKNLLRFVCISAILAGCSGTSNRWYSEYDKATVSSPSQLQYGSFSADMYGTDSTESIAVLLPTSGPNAAIGKSIRPAIEAAAMQFASKGTRLDFYDTGSGDVTQTIRSAVASGPGVIIGPVFAQNARILRDIKPSDMPALAFTSDISAVGDGVFSMSLVPTNTIESTIQEMRDRGGSQFIIIAPDNTSGRTMAGAAKSLTGVYNIKNTGVFYYNERDTESIKSTAMAATMYTARNAANTRAKEILSDILNKENLSASERSSVARQLENINRTDTLGKLPYDSVLFLGTGDDTKSMVSFLRYYGLGTRDAGFYGTPLWEDGDISSDIAMTGAFFATLPEIPGEFSNIYESATGVAPTRMAAIGYDATILALGAVRARDNVASYLMNQSGYIGVNGLFRLRPGGANERAMQIVRLNGDGTTTVVKKPVSAFTVPIYKTATNYIAPAEPMTLLGSGVNPMNYINIPERLKGKYKSKTYGANHTVVTANRDSAFSSVTVLPNNTNDFSITAEDYNPAPLENVSRTYIDSVEISD